MCWTQTLTSTYELIVRLRKGVKAHCCTTWQFSFVALLLEVHRPVLCNVKWDASGLTSLTARALVPYTIGVIQTQCAAANTYMFVNTSYREVQTWSWTLLFHSGCLKPMLMLISLWFNFSRWRYTKIKAFDANCYENHWKWGEGGSWCKFQNINIEVTCIVLSLLMLIVGRSWLLQPALRLTLHT